MHDILGVDSQQNNESLLNETINGAMSLVKYLYIRLKNNKVISFGYFMLEGDFYKYDRNCFLIDASEHFREAVFICGEMLKLNELLSVKSTVKMFNENRENFECLDKSIKDELTRNNHDISEFTDSFRNLKALKYLFFQLACMPLQYESKNSEYNDVKQYLIELETELNQENGFDPYYLIRAVKDYPLFFDYSIVMRLELFENYYEELDKMKELNLIDDLKYVEAKTYMFISDLPNRDSSVLTVDLMNLVKNFYEKTNEYFKLEKIGGSITVFSYIKRLLLISSACTRILESDVLPSGLHSFANGLHEQIEKHAYLFDDVETKLDIIAPIVKFYEKRIEVEKEEHLKNEYKVIIF